MILLDGTGTGRKLKINSDNRAVVESTAQTRIADVSSRLGQAFTIATGFVPLTTTASFTGILWIKNTDSVARNLFIEHIRVCGSAPMMQSVDCVVYRNPTTGTLISNAVAAYKTNNNFGSANQFNGLAYVGADANTITDGDWFTQFVTHISGHSIIDFNDSIVIPKGTTIGFALKPSSAMNVCMEVNCHFE